ncbi:MAG: hypothetical protein ACFFAN_05735 [Promethearchaeota archaeon]
MDTNYTVTTFLIPLIFVIVISTIIGLIARIYFIICKKKGAIIHFRKEKKRNLKILKFSSSSIYKYRNKTLPDLNVKISRKKCPNCNYNIFTFNISFYQNYGKKLEEM